MQSRAGGRVKQPGVGLILDGCVDVQRGEAL